MNDPNGQSLDRRSQIIDAAARLFAEFGYEATSVRQIADEVNILPGSLYHHFATKEEMLHDVMRANLDAMLDGNREVAQLPVDAEHRLVASLIMRLRLYAENWQFYAILVQESRFFRRNTDFAYVVEAKEQAFRIQEETLLDGMRSRLFDTGLDTYLMIGTISRMLTSSAAWFRSGDIFSSDKQSRYSIDMMIDFHIECVLRLVRCADRLAEPTSWRPSSIA